MNITMPNTMLAIGAIMAQIITSILMHKTLENQTHPSKYKENRKYLITIASIGVFAGLIGNVIKNPFFAQAPWVIAKDIVFITTIVYFKLFILNGLLIDVWRKKLPESIQFIGVIIPNSIALIGISILLFASLPTIQITARVIALLSLLNTVTFFILLMTGIIIRIIHGKIIKL